MGAARSGDGCGLEREWHGWERFKCGIGIVCHRKVWLGMWHREQLGGVERG